MVAKKWKRGKPDKRYEQGIKIGFQHYSSGKVSVRRLYGEKTLSWDEYRRAAISLASTKVKRIHAFGNKRPSPGHQSPSSTSSFNPSASPSSSSSSSLARSHPIIKTEHNTVGSPATKPSDELPTKEAIKEQVLQRIRERKVAEEEELQAQKEARAAESKNQCYIFVMDFLEHIPGLNCLLQDPAHPHAYGELSYDADSILHAIMLLTEWDLQMKSIQELTTASVRKLDMMDGLEILSNNAVTLVKQISGLMLRAAESRLALEDALFLLEK